MLIRALYTFFRILFPHKNEGTLHAWALRYTHIYATLQRRVYYSCAGMHSPLHCLLVRDLLCLMTEVKYNSVCKEAVSLR